MLPDSPYRHTYKTDAHGQAAGMVSIVLHTLQHEDYLASVVGMSEENRCTVVAYSEFRFPEPSSKDVVNQCLEFNVVAYSEHRFPAPSSKDVVN